MIIAFKHDKIYRDNIILTYYGPNRHQRDDRSSCFEKEVFGNDFDS